MRAIYPILILILSSAILPIHVYGDSVELLKADKSWNGGAFSYPQGEPEITSKLLRLNVGDDIPFHCHPVPTFGYVLEGTIRVKLKSGESAEFSKGQSLVEVFKTLHKGEAVGGPVEVLVFYAGAKGLENTLKEGDPQCITETNR